MVVFFAKNDHLGWDFVVYTITNTILHVATESSKRVSVQVAEFEGVLEAVRYVVKMNLKPMRTSMIVIIDGAYCIRSARGKWRFLLFFFFTISSFDFSFPKVCFFLMVE